jgi:hypothetical protein
MVGRRVLFSIGTLSQQADRHVHTLFQHIKFVYVTMLYWMYIISSHDDNCLFIICWTQHYSSCIADSRTNSTWIGNQLRIWCWNHEILVSQGTPIFQSYSGLSGFLGFLFWTTNSPCTRHTEKQTSNFIRRRFNQLFQYECSVKVLVCQMFQCIWKSVASNVYILPLVFPRRIIRLEHWWCDTEVLRGRGEKKTFTSSNGLILNSGLRDGRSVTYRRIHGTALQVDIRLSLYTKVSSYLESQWGRNFLHPARPVLGPTQPPVQWVEVSFPGVKRPGRGVDQPPPI